MHRPWLATAASLIITIPLVAVIAFGVPDRPSWLVGALSAVIGAPMLLIWTRYHQQRPPAD